MDGAVSRAMADFNDNVYALSVEGDKSTGQIYFPKEDYSTNMVSGNSKAYSLPEHEYAIKKRIATDEKGIKVGKAGYKYNLVALTEEGQETSLRTSDGKPKVWDPDAKAWRDSLLIHPDGGVAGTLGCVGIRGTPYKPGASTDATPGSADMNSINKVDGLLQSRPEGSVLVVKRFKTQKELDDFKKRQKDLRSSATGPSKTNNDAALLNGQNDVLAGKDQRKVAYVGGSCVHTGGGKVADGSCSVYVGTPQYKLARKEDPTTDGQIVKTGIPDILSA
jgi:hypothetical protein